MANWFDLTNKHALVTGGAGGIGYAIAEGLGAAGATVAILDRGKGLIEAATRLEASIGARVTALECDLLDRASTEAILSNHLARPDNRIDVLVNNAGALQSGPALDQSLDDIQRLFGVNVFATHHMACLAAKNMLPRRSGSIINLASIRSFVGSPQSSMYSATKGAVAQMTKSLSNEWAGSGIRVNALAPGYMDTPLTTHLTSNPEVSARILSRVPAGRWGKPDDLKAVAVLLASDASSYITGTVIPCDGGFLGF